MLHDLAFLNFYTKVLYIVIITAYLSNSFFHYSWVSQNHTRWCTFNDCLSINAHFNYHITVKLLNNTYPACYMLHNTAYSKCNTPLLYIIIMINLSSHLTIIVWYSTFREFNCHYCWVSQKSKKVILSYVNKIAKLHIPPLLYAALYSILELSSTLIIYTSHNQCTF